VVGQEAPWLPVQHKGRVRRHPNPRGGADPERYSARRRADLRHRQGLETRRHLWSKTAVAPDFRFPAYFIQAYIQQHRILDQGSCNHIE
jgi:hypothetical protein